MNSKFAVCINLLIVSIFLFAKPTLAEEVSDNAATYYNKAFELCTFSYKSAISKKVEDVVKNGWVSKDKELEELLKQNEPAIAEFEKGINLEKCDFAFGKVYNNPFEEPMPKLVKTRDLVNLIILKGRLSEYNKEYSQAIEQYLSALSFAQHISQSKLLVSVMMAKAIEGLALRPIQQYLEREQPDDQLCKEILLFLQNIAAKRTTLAEAMEREKEVYIWAGRQMIVGIENKLKQDTSKLTNDQLTKVDIFIKNLSESFKAIGDKYYGMLIKFAQTNLLTDKQIFEDELETLRRKFLIQNKSFEEYLNDMISFMSESPDRGTEEMANRIAELFALISMPNLVRTSEHYYLCEAKSKILVVATAIKIYAVEKNKIPDMLSELVPDYLNSIPIDPWSQKELKYIKTDKDFLVYSLGPDRTDNNGTGTGYEEIRELEGKDIVFSASLD